MRKKFLLIFFLAVIPIALRAQTNSLAVNVVDLANFGTLNAEMNISLGRHFSIVAGGRYNPWVVNSVKHDTLIESKNTTLNIGTRYWPWYVFSGWWVAAKAQYQSLYNTGVWRPAVKESMAVGGSLSAGYSIMVTKNFNIDLGLGVWGGEYLTYNLYHCQGCMELRDSGKRPFVALDDVFVSLTYLF